MKKNISVLIISLVTSLFFVYEFYKKSNINYTENGTFFSSENGIIYKEQTAEIYAIISVVSFIITLIMLVRLIKDK